MQTEEKIQETLINAPPHKKVALCFIISYSHILNQEEIWKKWIEPNKDWINVYVHYKDFRKISSPWLRAHCLPPSFIVSTSYYHVVSAYISLLTFAHSHDTSNQWFCMLTDSCTPLISPQLFAERFSEYNDKSIFRTKGATWNPQFHQRANLQHLPQPMRVEHDPWFTLTRLHVEKIRNYTTNPITQSIYLTVCRGGLANETIFALMLDIFNDKDLNDDETNKKRNYINSSATVADWSRRMSPTSPYLFSGTTNAEQNRRIIADLMKSNPLAMFLRKVNSTFVLPSFSHS